jgi:hypothetical protein
MSDCLIWVRLCSALLAVPQCHPRLRTLATRHSPLDEHFPCNMSLNWTMLNPDRSLVPLPNENIIITIDSGAELILNIPDAPPTGSAATAGGSGGARRLKEPGSIWLTDQRVRQHFMLRNLTPSTFRWQLIYVTPALGNPTPSFESFSVPLLSILSTKFEQPILGLNYLAFSINPTAGGGLTEGTTAEIRVNDRAMFQFVSLLEKTRERVIFMRRQSVDEEDGPRMCISSRILS